MPLAGLPRLTVLGSEVRLGNGYADILAVEPTGRPAIIEVKLARNPEARKEIVSQVLAYAAFLRGMSVEGLEQGLLGKGSAVASSGSILGAVQALDQEGAVDADTFTASLQEYLSQGNFRLVLVLDEISAELERIVAYLDAITVHALTIDVITLNIYEVNDVTVALPQRVSPDLSATPLSTTTGRAKSPGSRGDLTDAQMYSGIRWQKLQGNLERTLDMLVEWAEQLSSLPNVRLFTFTGIEGKRNHTLAQNNAGQCWPGYDLE